MFSLPQVDQCVCLSVSANLAHEQKGAEIQPSPRNLAFLHLPAQLLLKSTQPRKVPIKHPLLSEPSRGTIASHLFRAVQRFPACFTNTAVSGNLTSTEIPFFCLLCVNK